MFLALLVFAIYGSLIPFDFVPPSAEMIWGRLWTPSVGFVPKLSLADILSNVLLFVPLGFFGGGARAGRPRRVEAGVVGALALLSFVLEVVQTLIPVRTVSMADVAAETVGAMIGVKAWTLMGPSGVCWVWGHLAERRAATPVIKVLTVYAGLFTLSRLVPLDVTIDADQIWTKYAEGHLVLHPFSWAVLHPSALLGAFSGTVPLGVLAATGWRRLGAARSGLAASVVAAAGVWAIQIVQFGVLSRPSDVTEAVVGTLGACVGVGIGHRLSAHPCFGERRSRVPRPLSP